MKPDELAAYAPTATGTLRLTNSEMGGWRLDRRTWYLSYYRQLKPRSVPQPGSALSIGNRIHDCLAESWYVAEGTRRGDPLQWLESYYAEAIAQDLFNEDGYLKEKKLTTAMIEGYLEHLAATGIDQDITVLAPETMVEVPLLRHPETGEVLATLLSKLDARCELESTGQRLALEHKTVGSLTQVMALLQSDTQVLTEHLVEYRDLKAKGADGDRAQGVMYNMLKKVQRTGTARPPFYGREIVTHNLAELKSHWLHCQAIATEILSARARLDAGESHHTVCPPSPSRDLTWRNGTMFNLFVLMDDGSDWEAVIGDILVPVDPLERYQGVTSYGDVG